MNAVPLLPRRVALVIHSFDRGGSGRVAAHLARGFAARGITVEILIFRRGGEIEPEAIEIAGPSVSIRHFGRPHRWRALDLAFGLPRLVQLLRADRPDVVIAAANNAALVTALAFRLAGRRRGARLVLKTTNPVATSRHRGIARLVRRLGYLLAFRWTNAVWTLSPDESDEMKAAFSRHERIFQDVANPYVTDAMLEASVGGDRASGSGRIIAVARLAHQKRLERLVAAFAHVRHPGATLLILGEGEERASLEAQVARLGVADRVSMPGHVADVAPALREADLLVLTSDYEGLPAAVLEAMATNCPILSTDCFPAARSLLGRSPGCAIIIDHRPEPLARLIDAHLGQLRPTTLRQIAERFSIANGVDSHVNALVGAIGLSAG